MVLKRLTILFRPFIDATSQMHTGGTLPAGAMNTQRMMGPGSQMAGMQMRGVNQGGPRMAPPNMRNS